MDRLSWRRCSPTPAMIVGEMLLAGVLSEAEGRMHEPDMRRADVFRGYEKSGTHTR